MATYTANALNQYDQRTVPPVVDVLGSAAPGAVVTATSPDGTVTALRQGGDFAAAVPVVNKVSGQPVAKYPTIEIKGRVNEVNGQNAVTDTSSTQTGKHFLAGDPETFAHDEDGNLLHDGRWDYTWDGENRLIAVETRAAAVTAGVPRTKIEYAYDGRGRRIRQIVRTGWDGSAYAQAVARRFLYDSGWNVLAEIDEAGAVVRRCLWGLDVSGSREGAGGIGGLLVESIPDPANGGALTDCFPFYDGNGNITGLINGSGSEVARYEYGPFGETLRQSGPLAAANPWRWSTKWTEEATGLKDYGYRWLGDGRWLSRDPLGEPGGHNLYRAVDNDFVSNRDLLGASVFDSITSKLKAGLDQFDGAVERSLGAAMSDLKGAIENEIRTHYNKESYKLSTNVQFRLRKKVNIGVLKCNLQGGFTGTVSADATGSKIQGGAVGGIQCQTAKYAEVVSVSFGLTFNGETVYAFPCEGLSHFDRLQVGATGNIGLRFSLPGTDYIPGLELYGEGGGFVGLKVDLLKGWSSREYNKGIYARAVFQVDIGPINTLKEWRWSSGTDPFQ